MVIISYLVFLFVSHYVLLQLFRLTTYHRFFLKASPLLIGYAIAVAYLLYAFGLQAFFFWHLLCAPVLLVFAWSPHAKAGRVLISLVSAEDPQQQALVVASLNSTRAYYMLSSVAYVVSFAVAFVIIYNMH